MHRYYVHNPRGFANEYTVYVTEPDNDAAFRAALPQAQRITRVQAIEYAIRKPRAAARDQQQWYGGFAWSPGSEYQADRDLCGDPPTDADLIRYAVIATRDILEEEE